MPSQRAATERSPLLGQRHEGQQVADGTSDTEADTEARGAIEGSEADIERDEEAVRIARSIKYILPVLAVGV